MNTTSVTPQATLPSPRSQHPLVLGAAVAVTAFSLAGIASLLGWLPAHAPASSQAASAAQVAAAPTAPTAPAAPAVASSSATTVADAKGTTISLPPGATVNINNHTTHRTVTPRPVRETPPPAPQPVQPTAVYTPPPPVVTQVSTYPATYPAPYCRDCGVIESIRELPQRNDSSGLGALAGGVLGAAIGHNIGGGRGKDIATVAGMIGGAMAGNSIERGARNGPTTQIVVRMDDGSTRLIPADAGGLRVGERVRLSNGNLYPI